MTSKHPTKKPAKKVANKTTKPSSRRSPCPVAAALDTFGDKWTLLIIRDLLSGKSRFKDLVDSPEKIATNILAARLAQLVASGLINTTPSKDRANASDYHLTKKGRSLLPILRAMRDWGLKNVPGTQALIAAAPREPEARVKRAAGM